MRIPLRDVEPCPDRYHGVADRVGPAVAESNGRKGGAARREGVVMPESILEEVDHLLGAVSTPRTSTRPGCPSCGSADVAQVLGDSGGFSSVCTACGHSWS
jgi:hypothetical protein